MRIAALGVALMVILPACNGPKDAPAPAAAPVQAVAKETSPYEATNDLPADLFKPFPTYKDVTVQHVGRPRGVMREIWFISPAGTGFRELASYYQDELAKDGFRLSSPLMLAGRKTFSCQFIKDGRQGSVRIFPADTDKTRMSIDLMYEMPTQVDPRTVEVQEVFDVTGPGEVAQKGPNSNEETKRN
ncbi:MAG TPA: hypothetical protein VMU16_03640 [Candidatus Binataceae bacterium]|nr:hypothetical protein [Candidatus Binataceae bacterium]